MSISANTTKQVLEVLLNYTDRAMLINILNDLARIKGNASFNSTIKKLREACANS